MPLLGCLGLILILGIIAGEVYSYIVASHLLSAHAHGLIGGTAATDTILPIVLIQLVLMVVGWKVAMGAVSRLPTALMGSLLGQGDGAGRLILTALAGLLLVIPGFFFDVVAILLLLPPFPRLLAGTGQRVVMSIVRRKMGAMMQGGGMPGAGFPGGMAGMGGMFAGMQPRGPLQPDERLPRRPKVIDTTAERVDGKN